MSRSANWEPPYPAFSAAFAPEVERVVMAYYAVQSRDPARTEAVPAFESWIQGVIALPDGPDVVNRARHRSLTDGLNDIFILYWTDPERYIRWEKAPDVSEWWHAAERLQGYAGYWREVWRPPLSYLETLISSELPAGLAEANREVIGPVKEHAYWGAARDRIPQSKTDDLATPLTEMPRLNRPLLSLNARLRIVPPDNLCVIRSGQNWGLCGPEERELYMNDVYPVLIEGMNFLRDHPSETGCLSCRFMDEVLVDGSPQDKTFATAYFLSLKHLEAWAHSHPTHLAIFKTFHQLVRKRNFAPDLRLWHEVAVMPAETAVCEYVNCQPTTGLLPHFHATPF